jgi:hypothetical protein
MTGFAKQPKFWIASSLRAIMKIANAAAMLIRFASGVVRLVLKGSKSVDRVGTNCASYRQRVGSKDYFYA